MNRLLTLTIAAGVVMSLYSAPVQAQFITGRPGFPSVFVGSSSLQISSTGGQAPVTLYNNGNFAREYVGPDGGVTDVNNNASNGRADIPRTSDAIEAKIEKDDRLTIKWSGEPRAVARITFALLDKKKAVLKKSTITRLPAEAHFSITSKTSYYQILVEYINGTTTSVISPL